MLEIFTIYGLRCAFWHGQKGLQNYCFFSINQRVTEKKQPFFTKKRVQRYKLPPRFNGG
jgi:hypothetical protein